MRTIIAGSRTAINPADLARAIEAARAAGIVPSVVISGTASGADRLGEQWARAHGVPLEQFPANWTKYGKRAGYMRNVDMASKADALIALWDGTSRGTGHMIDIARRRGLLVHVQRIEP